MRKIEGLTLRRIGSENVIVAQDRGNINLSRIISLNETAAWLWGALPDTDFDVNELAALLTSQYEVDEATAHSDCTELINGWIKAGIIEE